MHCVGMKASPIKKKSSTWTSVENNLETIDVGWLVKCLKGEQMEIFRVLFKEGSQSLLYSFHSQRLKVGRKKVPSWLSLTNPNPSSVPGRG